MAYRYALIFCCFFMASNVIFAQGESSPAGIVRNLVEDNLAGHNWKISQLTNAPSCRHAIAVETSGKHLAFLCIEGMTSSIPRSPKDSRLSGLLVKRGDTTNSVTESRVTFYADTNAENLFLECTSFNSGNQGEGFYFWPNTSMSERANRSVVQVNLSGATCQPGDTVLGQIFEKHISGAKNNEGILVFSNDFDGKTLQESISFAEKQTENHIAPSFQALHGDYLFFASPIPLEAEVTKEEQVIKTGCNYNTVKCIQISTKVLWEVTPVLEKTTVAYSMVVPTHDGFVWWEYYASSKKPNGIWILRMWQRDTKTSIILAALRNVGSQFFQWNEGNWSFTKSTDGSLPVVGVVSTGEECYPSILGSIYTLQSIK